MKRHAWLIAGLFLTVTAHHAAAQPAKPLQQVQSAVNAMGGSDALQKLRSLSIKATAKHWEAEQSFISGGEARALGSSNLTLIVDREHGLARVEHEHKMDYPFPGAEKYSEIITPRWGAIVDDKGERPMSANRLAFTIREELRASPWLLLNALQDEKDIAALPDQKLGGKSYPAVAFNEAGTRFLILFDRKTHLPLAIRTKEDDQIHGDGVFDLVLGDWKEVAGVKLATSLSYKFNGLPKLDISYTSIDPNPAIAAPSFAVSDATKQAAKPPASGDVPWQAILVSVNFGRYNDLVEEQNAAAGPPPMKLVELAPNVSQALGRSHNSLIVAMKDYLVVFDAPQNEYQSRWTIDAAKAKYPGKPIKYLVMTHHHMDHLGGARTYVAEGATIIMGTPDKAHTVAELSGPRTMHPDALQKKPRPVKVVEVKDKMVLKDGEEIDIFRIANPHAEGMLTMYVAGPKIVWVTDIYSPGREQTKTPANSQFHETIKSLGLTPAIYAGGHGASGTETDFQALLAK